MLTKKVDFLATATNTKAGRKPKADEKKLSKRVALNFTEEEFLQLESVAEKANIPVGVLARIYVLSGLKND